MKRTGSALVTIGAVLVVLTGCVSSSSEIQRGDLRNTGNFTKGDQPVAASTSKDPDDVMRKARELADRYVAERASLSIDINKIKYEPALAFVEDRGDVIVFLYKMSPADDSADYEFHTDIALSYDKVTGKLGGLGSIREARVFPIGE